MIELVMALIVTAPLAIFMILGNMELHKMKKEYNEWEKTQPNYKEGYTSWPGPS